MSAGLSSNSKSNRFFRSYIFTFDSLGGKHPDTVANLQTYLQMEARDKKSSEYAFTTPPLSKDAIVCSKYSLRGHHSKHDSIRSQVPRQPNQYDCGVYLLHFAKIFLQNPASAMDQILVRLSCIAIACAISILLVDKSRPRRLHRKRARRLLGQQGCP